MSEPYGTELPPFSLPESNPLRGPGVPFHSPLRSMRVLVGQEDVSAQIDGDLTFSNVDPGGHEIASFSFARRVNIRRGQHVQITLGLETAWEGRVSEVSPELSGTPKTTVSCEGYGAKLKDGKMSMVYVGRDLGGWSGPSRTRLKDLAETSKRHVDASVGQDVKNNLPALVQEVFLTGDARPISDASYDAGPDNKIAAVYYDFTSSNLGSPPSASFWTWLFRSMDDDDFQIVTDGSVLTGADAAGLQEFATPRRYIVAEFSYLDTAASEPGTPRTLHWRRLAVFGDHGLPRRGDAPGGFHPDDIIRDVIRRAGIAPGVIEVASGFVIPHSAYKTPVEHEEIVRESATFMPWHWGTWDSGVIAGEPRFDFRPYPLEPTAWVSSRDCEGLTIPETLAGLYDTVKVTYTDPAEGTGVVTRTRANAELDKAEIANRTLTIDMGPGSLESATTFGDFVLLLAERQARIAGQATIAGDVRLPGGGRKPAALLRAGLDKLAITDLPDRPLLTSERCEALPSRVETRVGKQGAVTTVELGVGANLTEVLQARLAAVSEIAVGG